MSLRRAFFASPLAVLVAVLAHVAAFGSGHAPGAERAPALLGSLSVALALGVVAAFASGLLGIRGRRIESGGGSRFGPLVLAVAGAAAFAGIELGEGHFALDVLLRVACLSIPLAYVVAFVARATRTALRTAGASYGDSVCRASRSLRRAIAYRTRRVETLLAKARPFARAARGRAPPVLL